MKSNPSTSPKKEKRITKANRLLIPFVLLGALLLAGCAPKARVGEIRTESQSVDLGDDKSVRVEIDFGAGGLQVAGGAEKLLEAEFTYNVAELKPDVEYRNGLLVLQQPESEGLPDLRDITGFQNEWILRLNDQVPMDLGVNMGAGTGDLQLAGLSLTRLDIQVGAGEYKLNLSGGWLHNLDVAIDAGASDFTILLPRDVGVRVEVDRGPTMIDAPDLAQDGSIYTNAAYGVSEVTLQVHMQSGIGQIRLEIED